MVVRTRWSEKGDETVGISQSAIQKHIEHLKGAGIIIRLGSDRKGLWKVLK